jgi:dTDP-4-amino-4,6-dideoxygalactose transaminase
VPKMVHDLGPPMTPQGPEVSRRLTIPFNRSSLVGDEQRYIAEAMAIGQIAGDQTFGRRCEGLLQEMLGVRRVLLTTSCTHALEMCALLLRLGPGDEVIVPSFTFVSTANAFALRGAKPVFADVRPDTLNVDPDDIARKITPRTKAIVVVHYAGVACEIDRVLELGTLHGIPVVEDNAHGLLGRWNGRPLGSFGCLATQSFHETKNFTCGEGGALIVNNEAYVGRAEIIREKGTNRSRFFRGLVDKYSWVDLGSSYVMSDILAAFLWGQLEQRERIQARRQEIWERYDLELHSWAAAHGIRTPVVPAGADQAFHLYYLVMPSPEDRAALLSHLRLRGILAVFHYLPLHLSEMGRAYGGQPRDCPVAEKVADRLIRLPFFFSLSPKDQSDVIEAVTAFRPAPGNGAYAWPQCGAAAEVP